MTPFGMCWPFIPLAFVGRNACWSSGAQLMHAVPFAPCGVPRLKGHQLIVRHLAVLYPTLPRDGTDGHQGPPSYSMTRVSVGGGCFECPSNSAISVSSSCDCRVVTICVWPSTSNSDIAKMHVGSASHGYAVAGRGNSMAWPRFRRGGAEFPMHPL